MIPNPDNDGIDHINIYSKGRTELGKLLSNFAVSPFTYEPYGTFQSVEGFWYYYFTGCQYEILKTLSGYSAKKYGQSIQTERKDLTNADKAIILGALKCKLIQNKNILKLLIESSLPLKHYYFMSGKVILLPQYEWLVFFFENIREICKNNLQNEIT